MYDDWSLLYLKVSHSIDIMPRGRGKQQASARPTRKKRAPGRYDDGQSQNQPKKPKRSLSVGQASVEAVEGSDYETDGEDSMSLGHAHRSHHQVEDLEDQVKRIVGSAVSAAIPEVVKQVVAATAIVNNPSGSQSTVVSDEPNSQSPVESAIEEQTASILAGKVNNPALPLDLHLTADMKAKIIGKKYVKFGQLLYKDTTDNDKLTVQVTNQLIEGQHLTVNPYPHQVKIKDIATWDRAFSIYCYTYFAQHANEAQGLTQYGRLIKDMAWRGHQWFAYDQSFRRLREIDADSYPWGKIEPHLWSQYAIPHPNNSFGSSQNIDNSPRNSNTPQSFAPRGRGSRPFRGRGRGGRTPNFRPDSFAHGSSASKKCYVFNRGQHCSYSPCRYDHSCSDCGGNHPAANCRKN